MELKGPSFTDTEFGLEKGKGIAHNVVMKVLKKKGILALEKKTVSEIIFGM